MTRLSRFWSLLVAMLLFFGLGCGGEQFSPQGEEPTSPSVVGSATQTRAAGILTVVSAGPAVAPAAAAECFGPFEVMVSPTPVYYNDWSFYKFKHAGDLVRASGPQFLHNGTFFRQVVLGVGGYGWINSAKVRPDPGC